MTLRLNQNPDEDVLMMVNSKYFVSAGGGYSQMIATLVDTGNLIFEIFINDIRIFWDHFSRDEGTR